MDKRFYFGATRTARLAVALIAAAAVRLTAGIAYDAETNSLRITDFSEEAPATLDDLAAADRKNGWGKIAYRPKTDEFELNANLWIGDNLDHGTTVAFGGPERPKVKLLVRGWIWVRAPRPGMTRADGRAAVMNRLIMGQKDGPTASVQLRFDCRRFCEYGMTVTGGALNLYNCVIESAGKYPWGTIYPGFTQGSSPAEVTVVGCAVRGFSWQTPGFGATTGVWDRASGKIRPSSVNNISNTVFENGGAAFRGGCLYLRDCVFRNLDIALDDGGALSAECVNCEFSRNRQNWRFGGYSAGELTFIDCDLGNPRDPIEARKNALSGKDIPIYPTARILRGLTVKVLDSEDKPLKDVFVEIRCPKRPKAVIRGATMTEANGLTPEKALSLTAVTISAGDDPFHPRREEYEYEIVAAKDGVSATTGFCPGIGNSDTIILKLK